MLVSGLLMSRLRDSGPDGYPHAGSSFPYRPQKANTDFRFSRRRSDLSCHHTAYFAIVGGVDQTNLVAGRRLRTSELVLRAADKQGPQDPGMLGREGNGCLVEAAPLLQRRYPLAFAVLAPDEVAHQRPRPVDEHGAQVHVPAFGDTPMARLATGGALARHQAQPGGELPPGAKLSGIAHSLAAMESGARAGSPG